jgi:excisionase family DNA binding protein
METTTHPLTLTVEQAAKVLGISRSTAYELVHTGDIPSLRFGRRIVIPAAKLADQLGLDQIDVDAAKRGSSAPRDGSDEPRTLF